MSTPTVERILVALKVTFDKNVSSHFWQGFGSSQSYDSQPRQLTGYIVKKVANPTETENVKCARPTCEGE